MFVVVIPAFAIVDFYSYLCLCRILSLEDSFGAVLLWAVDCCRYWFSCCCGCCYSL